MSSLTADAIDELTRAIVALLPAESDPVLQPSVFVYPSRVAPTGVGSLIGPSEAPRGEILGLRVEALVTVTVRSRSADDARSRLSNSIRALAGTSRDDLRRLGLFRLALPSAPRDAVERKSANGETLFEQELRIDLLYEFVKRPSAESSTLSRLYYDVETVASDDPRLIMSCVFDADFAEYFDVVDDRNATHSAPSSWRWDPGQGCLSQGSSIWGGSSRLDANKPGTYLVLKATAKHPPVRDFMMRVRLRSDGEGGIGVVFRWQGPEDFLYFLMDREYGYRMVAKKSADRFAELSVAARDPSRSYEPGAITNLKIVAVGADVSVFLQDELVLRGSDDAPPAAGRVGAMCRNNDRAYFHRFELVKL